MYVFFISYYLLLVPLQW